MSVMRDTDEFVGQNRPGDIPTVRPPAAAAPEPKGIVNREQL